MVPQLAAGGCTPMERNDRADSVNILNATINGKKTMMLGVAFGRISFHRIRTSEAPEPTAA